MHRKFESLSEYVEFITLNNIVFNVSQIKNSIVQDFKSKNNDLNFCRKNKFLKKNFREINNQGIFNRIEWKFWLKEDIRCELITLDKTRQVSELQIRVILDFSPAEKLNNYTASTLSSEDSNNSEYLDLKVLLDCYLQESEVEVEEIFTIDSIETIALKSIHEQKTANFDSLNSEKICI